MRKDGYTAALAKGHGITDETMALLAVWELGMSARQLAKVALEEGMLGRATAKRVEDLVIEVFAPRYLVDHARPAKQLKALLDTGVNSSNLSQLFLVYTARANAVLHDFICDVYWDKYSAGASHITTQDAYLFLEIAYNLGKLPKKWSDKMTSRVASGLCACLADFDLLEQGRKRKRAITPIRVQPITSLYLAHDLHFAGHSDNGILDNPDWQLFGFEGLEVVRELQRVSSDHFILQYSGDLLRISWKYQSMEEAIRAITRSEL
jgi:hypothetical protein